jgi:hypothetical protein
MISSGKPRRGTGHAIASSETIVPSFFMRERAVRTVPSARPQKRVKSYRYSRVAARIRVRGICAGTGEHQREVEDLAG